MGDVDFSKHYRKNGFHDLLFRWVDRSKIKILKRKFDGSDKKILDLGCGTGEIVSQISGCEKYGVDYNDALLSLAKRNGLKVKNGKFDNIPFPNATFDVVVCIDTIEHVESRNDTFKEICRVLKPNGELILFTPAYDSILWVLAEKTVNMITGYPSGHKSPWIPESLDFFMKKYFKKVEKCRHINFSLGLYISGKGKK